MFVWIARNTLLGSNKIAAARDLNRNTTSETINSEGSISISQSKSHVTNEADAFELLEAINDVLTWFCLDQPEAKFCRTIVLSGFTLSPTEGQSIDEANNRFDALVALGKNGMLGTYEHSEKSAMDITTCSNTYLLIQTYPPARDDINQLTGPDLSETCIQMGACWKSMRYRAIRPNFGIFFTFFSSKT